MPLYGRDAERAALAALAEAARESCSGVLIIRGAPGTGKSALLDDVAVGSPGMRVLRATGIQGEAELAFAGLHQLVWPLRNLIGQLAGAQAAVLRGVLGAAQDPPPGQFQVGAATLELLAAAAEDRPLLALVDDAHWLDGPSAEAITFAARRLHADAIALVLAMRDGPQTAFDGAGFSELHLRGLDIRAAGALLDSSGPLEPSVRSEVLRIADGNPLALLELPRALASQPPGGEPAGEQVPLTPALEDPFLARVRALPTPSQLLLLLAAADSTADPAVVLPAARHLGIETGDIDAAKAAGLLRLTATEVSFRHPLVRSAVYQSAPFSERAQVHRALARTADPDRRAWHQAAALDGPDDTVADALEQSAVRARARSGYAAAAALQRSASLTSDPGTRARRLAAAAEAAWLSGRPGPAAVLLRQAHELAADPGVAADIEYTQALIEMAGAVPADANARLTRAAATVAAADPGRAQKLVLQAREAAYLSADSRAEAQVSRQAADLAAAQAGDPFAAAFLDGFARWLGPDPGSAVPRLRQAVDFADQSADPRRLFWAGLAALTLGDDEQARRFFGQDTARARSEGSVAMVAQALTAIELLQGHGASARAAATEGLELAEATGQRNIACIHLALLARVAASFGTEDETRSLVTQFNQATANHRLPPFEDMITVALGEMELARGNAERALAHLSEVAAAGLRPSDPLNRIFAVPSYAEASIRVGQPDLAASAAASFSHWAAATQSAPDLALHARLLALLAPAGAADPHFAEALRLHLTAQRPFDRARTELLYGESLRRRRERLRAREHLRVALDLFERLGAHPWSGRARAELRATGETARPREPGFTEQLTPRELQVARFIAAGASTRQAASQMFLSPRTIDAHLRSIYAKFGITSRTELRAADLGEITHHAAQ
jgi:DNA-binding CsgD family transcriptional regulator